MQLWHLPAVLNATNERFMHCDNRAWNLRRHMVRELAGKMTSMPQPTKEFWIATFCDHDLCRLLPPSCSASFLYFKEGKLFRLELDPTLGSKSNRLEYFWLCPGCSSTMTLRLSEDGTVVTVLIPEHFVASLKVLPLPR
jgi:hypothetical protein